MITNTLSISKVINGLSRTLNVINQVIPLYQQTKPVISNIKNIYDLVKNNNNSFNKKQTIDIKVNKKNTSSNIANPVFFQ